MATWLVKSEPYTYSIDNLAKDKETFWDGVRNFQARSFLIAMQVGDKLLFYHSNSEPIGVVGVAEVVATAQPDQTQFDKKSEYYEPRSTSEKPLWFSPKIKFKRKFSKIVTLSDIKLHPLLNKLAIVKKGNRLSVMPVEKSEFELILEMSD
jgi:predicted RNA-binding protein with PUA-like domain